MSGTVIKTGWLTKYSKGIFGEKWKKVYAILYSDSTFCWYKDKGNNSAKGSVNLKNVCKFLTCGVNVRTIPHSPSLPSWAAIENIIAFPDGPSKKSYIYYFLTNDQAEFNLWMTAITNTLPAPPQTGPCERTTSSTQLPFDTPFSSEQSVSRPSPQQYGSADICYYGTTAPPVPSSYGAPLYPQPTGSSIGFEQLSLPLPPTAPSGQGQPTSPYGHTAINNPPMPQLHNQLPANYPAQSQNYMPHNLVQPSLPVPNAPNYYGYHANPQYPVQGYNPQYPQQQNMQQAYGTYQQPTQPSVLYHQSPKKSKGTGKMLAGIAGGAVAGYAASRIVRPFGGFGWGHGSWGSGSWGSFSGGSFGSFGGCD